METSNAKRIFSDNVTCFGKNKSCSNRSHLSGCFKCSSILACKALRAQLSICFPISLSRIHLAASLHLCPADCFQEILIEQARPLTGTSRNFSDILVSINISCRWVHESSSLDINKANSMEFDHVYCMATLIPNPSHSKENDSKCWKSLFALSGQNQAHNWKNIFHMNVLSNMLLY